MTDLMTIKECLDAIKEASKVLVEVRFGCFDYSVEITKKEARRFLGNYCKDATPHDYEMPYGHFGTFENGILRLG